MICHSLPKSREPALLSHLKFPSSRPTNVFSLVTREGLGSTKTTEKFWKSSVGISTEEAVPKQNSVLQNPLFFLSSLFTVSE